jgi:hypothetical protein
MGRAFSRGHAPTFLAQKTQNECTQKTQKTPAVPLRALRLSGENSMQTLSDLDNISTLPVTFGWVTING